MQRSLKQSAVKGFASFETRLTRSLFLLTLFYSIIVGLILLISASITYSAFSSRINTRFNRLPPQVVALRIIGQIRQAQINQIRIASSDIPVLQSIQSMENGTSNPSNSPSQQSSQQPWPTAEEVRDDLIISLIFVNGFLFLIAVGGSYVLARMTLRPLKYAYQEQRRFIADASHELRTPLAVMRLELENQLNILESKNPDKQSKIHSDVKSIESKSNTEILKLDTEEEAIKSQLEEIDRMNKIVQNLLLLSKLDGVELSSSQTQISSIDIHKAVEDTTRRLHALAKKHNIHLNLINSTSVNQSTSPILIKGNEQVSHILTNIIQNAILYNKPEGTIDISIGSEKTSRSFVAVTVTDTGVGISKNDLAHIFDRFYRVDKSRSRATGGSGLGLSIVERSITSIGGNIGIESELGKGTTVTLYFKKA